MSSVSKAWPYLKSRKQKWLKPILTVVVVIGILVLLTDGEVLEPFTYMNF